MSAKALVKVILACSCIAAIVEVAGADLFPATSFVTRLIYAGCIGLCIMALAAVAIFAGQLWNCFSLNQGATDPQWMWFGEEPPGLKIERERGTVAADTRKAGSDGSSDI